MSNAAGRWRTLSAPELAAEPEVRFGGAIAVIFFAATFALLPVVFLIVNTVSDPKGTTWVVLMMVRQAFGGDMKSAYMASSLLQMLTLLIWAAIFVTVTLARARPGPAITAVAFAIAALVGPVAQCAIVIAFSGDMGGILAAAAQLPHMVLNLVAAVVFWVYMQEGRRPNLYFRRRMHVAANPATRTEVSPVGTSSA